MKRVLNSFTLTFLILLPVVIAQTDLISGGLLRAIIGPLPQACTFSISSSDCIACLGTAKILPFAFFFGLIYFAMVFIIFRMFGGLPTTREGQQQPLDVKHVAPSFYFAAILVSLILALLMLHFREVSMLFLSIGQLHRILILVFSIVVVVTFLYAIHPLHPMLGLAVLLFSIGIVWTFYNELTQTGELSLLKPTLLLADNPCFLVE